VSIADAPITITFGYFFADFEEEFTMEEEAVYFFCGLFM
jgi:hypothetical protein